MKWKYLGLLGVATILGACSPTNPRKEAPVEELGSVQINVAQQQAAGKPKVDILFVVDNSLSMEKHQDNLASNIDGFVEAFSKNASIDFHIGAVPIYDSVKFGKRVKTFYPLGQLLPLRNPKDPQGSRLDLPPYVTPETPDYLEVLRATLHEGEAPGPEFEESFSPVEAALSQELQNGFNKGFYRPDATLVIAFLTDADDSSPTVSADQLYVDLMALKNNSRDKLVTVGVIVPIGADNCPRDPSGPPFKITKFLTMTGGTILNLCDDNFGEHLAAIGTDISEHVGRQVIKLSAVPDLNTLSVKFGSQIVPADPDTGWSYDPSSVSIILSGKLKLNPEPGAEFSIGFVPVKLMNVKNGRTHRIGNGNP